MDSPRIKSLKTPSNKSKSVKTVMKKLWAFVEEEISHTAPFKVTYIGRRKAKIVKYVNPNDVSTDVE